VTEVLLTLPEDEAQDLYRLLHRTPDGEDRFCESYRQLQLHFFRTLTVEQVQSLLEGDR
jgi:hypothetical protein